MFGDDKCLINSFVRGRKEAEQMALKRLRKASVSIYDIYDYFDLSAYGILQRDYVIKKEIEIDTSSFVPVKKIVEKVNRLRKKGRIVFISDMYLPESILRDALQRLGIVKEQDHIYVSCDCNCTKHSGTLFDYVKKKENISFWEWTHFGDNRRSDFLIPFLKGIQVRHIKNGFTNFERMWLRDSDLMGDLSLSVFSGIIRSTRLSNYMSNKDEFVPDIMGSLLVSFTIDTLNEARRKGLKKLFFMARDTFLMYKTAELFADIYSGIEIKYLYLSTRVLYPMVIEKGEPKELEYIYSRLDRFRPKDILELLEYNENDVRDIGETIDIESEICQSSDSAEILTQLLLTGSRKESLLSRVAKKRKLLISYLDQEGLGLNNCDPIGIVDIGWRGTSQAILEKLCSPSSTFYYLGVSDRRLSVNEFKKYTSCIFFENSMWFSAMTGVIEYYMCKNKFGTTLGYEKNNGKIEPIYKKKNCDNKDAVQIDDNKDIVLQIAQLCHKYQVIYSNTSSILKNSMNVLREFSLYPNYHLVKPIAPHLVFKHYSKEYPIVMKIYPWTIIYILTKKVLSLLRHISQSDRYMMLWLCGSVSYTYGPFGGIFTHAYQYLKSKIVNS